jgi:hypothetical protein
MQIVLDIKDKSKAELLMEFLKSLNYVSNIKAIDIEKIPDAHKKLVRERIKKSKDKELLDWDVIKNEFNGI